MVQSAALSYPARVDATKAHGGIGKWKGLLSLRWLMSVKPPACWRCQSLHCGGGDGSDVARDLRDWNDA